MEVSVQSPSSAQLGSLPAKGTTKDAWIWSPKAVPMAKVQKIVILEGVVGMGMGRDAVVAHWTSSRHRRVGVHITNQKNVTGKANVTSAPKCWCGLSNKLARAPFEPKMMQIFLALPSSLFSTSPAHSTPLSCPYAHAPVEELAAQGVDAVDGKRFLHHEPNSKGGHHEDAKDQNLRPQVDVEVVVQPVRGDGAADGGEHHRAPVHRVHVPTRAHLQTRAKEDEIRAGCHNIGPQRATAATM